MGASKFREVAQAIDFLPEGVNLPFRGDLSPLP